MSCLRSLVDVRQVPLLVGAIQIVWALIMGEDTTSKAVYTLLEALGVGDVWAWIIGLSGAYLIVGGLFRRRETLVIALTLGAVVWTVMCIMSFHHWYWYHPKDFITISILSMPLYAVSLWYAFFREVYLHPRLTSRRRPHLSEPY